MTGFGARNAPADPSLSIEMTMAESFKKRRTSIGGRSLSRWSLRSEKHAMLARFLHRDGDGNFGPESVCRSVSRRLLGHGFGAKPAPCSSSLFCFGCAALRVTVSRQILFVKNNEKISPEPP